jgi:rhamnulose-1-phosphate aldolase
MNILETPIMREFIRTAADANRMGWHELNGGNLSYRLTEEEIEAMQPHFTFDHEFLEIGVECPELAMDFFIFTASGKFFRNTELDPASHIGIIKICGNGTHWSIVWGFADGGRPTIELPTHLLNHAVRKRVTGGKNRVIYHAHPPAILAMTFVLPLSERVFSRALWQSMTECVIVFPRGVGVVEWMIPGTVEAGLETSKKMEKYTAAVWAHHGLFVSGETLIAAFGLMETIEKAADIHLRALSAGRIIQTITDGNLRDAAEAYGQEPNEEFLD